MFQKRKYKIRVNEKRTKSKKYVGQKKNKHQENVAGQHNIWFWKSYNMFKLC